MISSNNKWLIHTLLVGLIPILTRFITWAVITTDKLPALAAADFITLGLVIHISIMNELEHVHDFARQFKPLLSGASMVCITIYGTLYALITIGEHHQELINVPLVLNICICFCIASTILGFVLFPRFSKRSAQ